MCYPLGEIKGNCAHVFCTDQRGLNSEHPSISENSKTQTPPNEALRVAKKMKKVSLLFIVVLSILGCQKPEDGLLDTMNNYYVTPEMARQVVFNFVEPSKADAKTESEKEIISLTALVDSIGQNTIYICNYTQNDSVKYALVPGDTRDEPIIAYGNDSFATEDIPEGLADWLIEKVAYVSFLREQNIEQWGGVAELWQDMVIYPDEDTSGGGTGDCNGGFYYQYGPLIVTNWGQGCSYNDFCPTESELGCSVLPCDRAHTGCVATAVAQVMRYHGFPANHAGHNYTWATMPNTSGNTNVARLMRDIGDEVNMDYDCDGSGANTSAVVDDAFEAFGYSSDACYQSWSGNFFVVRTEIEHNRPLVFRGGRKATFLGVPYYADGHAWVCDGFRESGNDCYGYASYHMNWGWGGQFNGWYSYGSFNPGSYSFNYQTGIVKNIHP